jgi:hypothetical protein
MSRTLFKLQLKFTASTVVAVFLLLFAEGAFGQKTLNQGKADIHKILTENPDPTFELLKYLETHPAHLFESKTVWNRLNKYCAVEAEKVKGKYYSELIAFIGQRMYNYGYSEDSFYYLYKADQAIKDEVPEDKKFLTTFHESYGLAFFYYKRFDEAKREIKLAMEDKSVAVNFKIGLVNTYGLIFRELQQTDSAKHYFQYALHLAEKSNNRPWIGVLSGNLGHIYFLEKDLDKAYALCNQDFKISTETNQYGSAINALDLLIRIEIETNRLGLAEKKLALLDSLVNSLEYHTSNYRTLFNSKTAISQAKGNYKDALEFYKLTRLYSDSIQQRYNQENLQKTEFQIHFEQKQAELSILRTNKRYSEILIYGLIAVTILSVIVFIWILRLNIRKRRREKELSDLRRQQVQQELEVTESQLRGMLSNLMEKNSMIETLTAEIEQFNQGDNQQYSEERMKMLDKLQSFTLLTDDDWLEFKNLFEKLNPNFFTKVLKYSPDLTNAELRLITLIKLNLSNLEMSRTLGISPDSVRKTGLRLRKKWNMDQPEDLVKFILSL